MDPIKFWTICTTNGIVLSKEQLDLIERYTRDLLYWNQKVNMISRQDEENILERHILHSLSILKYIDFPTKSKCLDIGTGGGLPGIPISIAIPDLRILLVDSIQKKIKMTEMFRQHLNLKYCSTLAARVETLHEDINYHKYFDFIISRAVSKTATILDWSKNLLKNNGKIVLLKGGDLKEEIDEVQSRYKNINIQEIPISMMGADWFVINQKKLLICSFN